MEPVADVVAHYNAVPADHSKQEVTDESRPREVETTQRTVVVVQVERMVRGWEYPRIDEMVHGRVDAEGLAGVDIDNEADAQLLVPEQGFWPEQEQVSFAARAVEAVASQEPGLPDCYYDSHRAQTDSGACSGDYCHSCQRPTKPTSLETADGSRQLQRQNPQQTEKRQPDYFEKQQPYPVELWAQAYSAPCSKSLGRQRQADLPTPSEKSAHLLWEEEATEVVLEALGLELERE